MKARILLVLAVALALVVSSSASVAAGGAVVPFKACYQTYPVMVGFDSITGILTWEIPGDGQATHLGNSTFYSDSWVNLYLGPPVPGWGIMEFTAANGDQLFGAYEGYHLPGVFEGTFQTTGGTGRFEDTSGSGIYWGWTDGVSGEICFDGLLTK